LKPLNGLARRWQRVAAAGQRVRGDPGRHWQSVEGPREGFVSWWTVLRGRFETFQMDYGDMARRWEGSGKALKAYGRVSCPGGPCFAAVLKPSKWTLATWPGAGKGLPLQGNVFALTWKALAKR